MTTSTEVASEGFITPDWPAPANVRTLITTRRGGVSRGVYASLNLGDHVGDDPLAVAKNRALVSHRIGARPLWLKQVHGTHVVEAGDCLAADPNGVPEADASFTHRTGVACAVMTADCLPVLFCNPAGTVVAAAHAGWRGLLDGVLEATMGTLGAPGDELIAYLGPAIGPQAFEVGDEVRAAFVARSRNAEEAFHPGNQGKWFADLYLLARQRLSARGVAQVYGGDYCTVTDADRFFSYRRDGQTGRMASLIWLDQT